MAKDPADRPRDATAVLERLRPGRRARWYALGAVAVIAAIAIAWPRAHEWQPALRLHTLAYSETGDSIAVSHDGKWLAYDSDRDGHVRIWIEPVDGGEARPVTPPDWLAQVPRFTADDRALLVKHLDRIRTMTTVQSLSRIERVPLDGGAPELIANGASGADDCAGRIVLGYNSEGSRPARIAVRDHGTEQVLAVLGTDVELGRIRCSPAGDTFAFNARGIRIGGRSMQLFVGHVDRLGVSQLTRGTSAARPSFTLDGKHLLFASGSNALAELPVDGGASRLLIRSTDPLSEAVPLPDGMLLYLRDTSSLPVSRIDLETGAATRLARPADWVFQAAPACGGLALVTTPTFALERWLVVLVDLATNRTREVGQGGALAATADGATIVVAQVEHGMTHLRAFGCDARSRELATMPGVIGHIALARGIAHFTLTGNACVAWRVPLAGGPPECEGMPPLQHVIPAPVGDHVIAVRDGRLRLIAPGHPLDDASAPEFDGETAAWAPAGDAFYYWDGHAVVRHELATGRDRALYASPLFVGALAPMPDGKTLYFSSIAGEVRREVIANFASR